MLWMKSWYEVRLRFLAGFVFGAATLFIRWTGGPATSRQDAVAIMVGTSLLWIFYAFYLSGAGVKTQSAFMGMKGLHGSTYFTLSLPVSRFQLAKAVLKKFVTERPDDRIGLVVFAAQAFIASPMTLDHDYLLQNIERLEIGTINSDATAIGDGLTTALNRLRNLQSKSRIVVLMTDGGNNSGKIDPITATEAAQTLQVKIYTIGLGNREIVQQMGLPPGYLPDNETLQKIAQMTGGVFYQADNSEKLNSIYDQIDKLEKTEAVVNKFTQYKELFPWFVGGGLILLLVEILLGQTVFRRLP